MNKPYVVSADVKLLVNNWARKLGFKPVPDWCFRGMREEFSDWMRQMFKGNFVFVSEDEILSGLDDLTDGFSLPTVSLNRAYLQDWDAYLDVTRLVDEAGNDCGLGYRKDITVNGQLQALSERGFKDVALVDDVIFTGTHVRETISMFSKVGIRVPVVITGIGIDQGVQLVRNLGVEVRCVRSFSDVVDEVCERDFYPGVSMSGRSLAGVDNVGVPYLLPFGKPGKWASIPGYFVRDFSIRCIRLARDLFHQIGHSSNPVRPIRCCDLDRGIVGLPRDETEVEGHLEEIQGKLVAGFDFGNMEMHNC